MGSRGLSYAPLTAEILAAEIAGEQPSLPRELLNALHPARFIIRDLKRNRI
jgi:tRNA 5-methylaminomethyl-2-thiouridine biosynthesis bifunctional protein